MEAESVEKKQGFWSWLLGGSNQMVERDEDSYFMDLFRNAFPNCRMEYRMPVRRLNQSAQGPCQEIDFAFFPHERCVLAVCLGETPPDSKRAEYQNTRRALEQVGARCLYFARSPHNDSAKVTEQVAVALRRAEEPESVWSVPAAYDGLAESFAALFSSAFPNYQIARNVPSRQLSPYAAEWYAPVDFAFYRGGRCVLAVCLCEDNYRNRKFMGVQESMESAGIPYLRFFRKFPNERQYVLDRVARALR